MQSLTSIFGAIYNATTSVWSESAIPEITSVSEIVPLSSATTSMRLIEILVDGTPTGKDHDEGTISCRLYTTDLKDKPAYTALSYMWGTAPATKTILLNGQNFKVRENLWDFLCQMRDAKHKHNGKPSLPLRNTKLSETPACCFPLWIDAICIDQTLLPEKNHQVAIMGDIYSDAQIVVSWLGRGNERLYKGMQAAQCVLHQLDYSHPNLRHFIDDFNPLYEEPYWLRVWVVQEIVLSRRLELWCGPEILDGDLAVHSARYATKEFGNDKSTGNGYAYSLLLHRLGKTLVGQLPAKDVWDLGSFGDALIMVTRSACSDIRDRVYAILSLLDPEDRVRLDLQPDYAKTADELFVEVSHKIWHNLARYDRKAFKTYLMALGLALGMPPSYRALDKADLYDVYPSPKDGEFQKKARSLKKSIKSLMKR